MPSTMPSSPLLDSRTSRGAEHQPRVGGRHGEVAVAWLGALIESGESSPLRRANPCSRHGCTCPSTP